MYEPDLFKSKDFLFYEIEDKNKYFIELIKKKLELNAEKGRILNLKDCLLMRIGLDNKNPFLMRLDNINPFDGYISPKR